MRYFTSGRERREADTGGISMSPSYLGEPYTTHSNRQDNPPFTRNARKERREADTGGISISPSYFGEPYTTLTKHQENKIKHNQNATFLCFTRGRERREADTGDISTRIYLRVTLKNHIQHSQSTKKITLNTTRMSLFLCFTRGRERRETNISPLP